MKKLYDGAPPTKLLPKPKAFMGHPLHLGCAIGSRASFLLKAMPSGGGVANHLDEARRAELQHDLEAFHDGFATDLGIALPHEYLLTISTRRRQSHDSALLGEIPGRFPYLREPGNLPISPLLSTLSKCPILKAIRTSWEIEPACIFCMIAAL